MAYITRLIVSAGCFIAQYQWALLVCSSLLLAGGCHTDDASTHTTSATIAGQQLAKKYCTNCHLAVTPDQLDKETWIKRVLPAMAPKLGIEAYEGGYYYATAHASISYNDWQTLVAYFDSVAPVRVESTQTRIKVRKNSSLFEVIVPTVDTTILPPVTTMVSIDTIGHQLVSSDGLQDNLSFWNQKLRLTNRQQLPSPAVQATFYRDKKGEERGMFTCLGTMQAADIDKGELIDMQMPTKAGRQGMSASLYKELPRPVQSLTADFNKDGLSDWVVCGFGHSSGGLYWLKQGPKQQFTKLPIREVAGALQVSIGDFNGDGWPDIMALFAHAEEGVWLFTNDRNGGFKERSLLRFPPVYGSTSFQLVDFDNDGQLDILYTCGDNSDYSPILKRFHGIYIFRNIGNFNYQKTLFYHINGCTKAIAADFNVDGKLDIISIAFYADFKRHPTEGCIYLEHNGNFNFQPYELPLNTLGRWICMDVGDWDQDGDADVMVGNFSKGFINYPVTKPTWGQQLPYVLLQNKTKRNGASSDLLPLNWTNLK